MVAAAIARPRVGAPEVLCGGEMTAVEETMRHSPIATTLLRVVAEDVELAGVHFPEGTLVFANTAAAKRDPAIYGDPDRLDITREPGDTS
jgi:cytochrome P450